ncbi:hypothetical protein FOL47_002582 [Perkinsus chesapeaki]|uniref:EF-hand domain-containing protein n=1 Tax=Perkinsus chesapeaki TaxID=330153 RepID=A0A7J6MDX6_PERCH|nr:hypothetical protein FOL47_002582 [Perkinsus chesapeaki]
MKPRLVALAGMAFSTPTSGGDFGHLSAFYYLDSDKSGTISRRELLDFVMDIKACGLESREEQLLLTAKLWNYYRSREEFKAAGEMEEGGLGKDAFMWMHREMPLFCHRLQSAHHSWTSLANSFLLTHNFTMIDSIDSAELSCDEYWNGFVAHHEPLVIRNAIRIPEWSQRSILNGTDVGGLEVKLETPVELRGVAREKTSRMALRELDPGKEWYVVSTMPQAMAWKVEVPRWGIRDGLVIEENGLWVSPAGKETRSSFHYDKENVMNCLVAGEGEKLWWFIDTRKYGDVVPWVRKGRYNISDDSENTGTDWLALDLDAIDVDLHRYWLDKVEIRTAVQRVGDCMFVPYSMLHLAWSPALTRGRSSAIDFNAAAAWTFLSTNDELPYRCGGSHRSRPLAVLENVWPYVGYGAVPQGFPDPNELRLTTLGLLDEGTTPEARSKQWRQVIAFGLWRLSKSYVPALEAFRAFAMQTRDNGLTVEEAPLDLWRLFAAAIDATDESALPCNVKRSVYVPLDEIERTRIAAYRRAEKGAVPDMTDTCPRYNRSGIL